MIVGVADGAPSDCEGCSDGQRQASYQRGVQRRTASSALGGRHQHGSYADFRQPASCATSSPGEALGITTAETFNEEKSRKAILERRATTLLDLHLTSTVLLVLSLSFYDIHVLAPPASPPPVLLLLRIFSCQHASKRASLHALRERRNETRGTVSEG